MITLRDMRESDRAYVLSTWVESEEEHTALPGGRDRTFDALRAKAGRLLARSRVLVAAPVDDAITVLAWLCVDAHEPVVHYAYTRRAVRRSGLQRDLVRAAGIEGKIRASCRAPKRPDQRVHHDPVLGWMLAVMEPHVREDREAAAPEARDQ